MYIMGLDACEAVRTPIWVLAFCGLGIVTVQPPGPPTCMTTRPGERSSTTHVAESTHSYARATWSARSSAEFWALQLHEAGLWMHRAWRCWATE